MENTTIVKTEAVLIKNEIRKALRRSFKKHEQNNNIFSGAEIVKIYSDCLKQLLQPIEGNIYKETYLVGTLLKD